MIARKSVLIMGISFIGQLLGFLALIFVARYMGPNTLGIIGFGVGFMGLFNFITYLGFDVAHIKRVSEGKDLANCIGTYLVIKIVLTSVMVITVIGALFIWKSIFHGGFESSVHEGVIYILLISFSILSFARIMIDTFVARRETAKQQISLLGGTIVQALGMMFVAVMSFGIFMLVGTYILGAITTFIFALLLFRNYPVGKPSKEYFKSYSMFAFPLILATMNIAILLNVDKIMIQLFLGTKEVGYYFTVQKMTAALMFIGSAVNSLLFPTMSSYSTKNNFKEIRRLTLLGEKYLSMIITPILAFIFLFSRPIVCVFLGNAFTPAYLVLSIFSIIVWSRILVVPLSSQIRGLDKPSIVGKTCILMVVLNILLNLLLIPKSIMGIGLAGLGIEGAAIATLFAFLSRLIIYRIVVYKLTETRLYRGVKFHLLSAGGMSLSLYIIGIKIPVYEWYGIVGLALVGLGVYFGLLFLMQEFTKEDFNFFLEVLNPKKMIEYVKSEI